MFSHQPNPEIDDTVRIVDAGRSVERVRDKCPQCETGVDVSAVLPLTEISCAHCKAIFLARRRFGHYQIESLLGRGGAGAVYKGFDTSLGRRVALKVLREELSADVQAIARFDAEAKVTASINHPNVVRIFDHGACHGMYYIALELLEGGSLAQLIERHGQLPEAQVLEFGIQAAGGLKVAYEAGLVHRDIKPANLLLAASGHAKIIDFGASTLPGGTDAGEGICGSAHYLAPERLEGAEDLRSDIYSLGASLFHALAGRPPFEGATAEEVVQKGRTRATPHVHSFTPGISDATAAIIDRCLQRDPDRRFQTYDDLIENLEFARDRLASSGAGVQKRRRLVIEHQPYQMALALLALGLAAIVVIAFIGFLAHQRTLDQAQNSRRSAVTQIGAKAVEYRPLDMHSVYTADTRGGIFGGALSPRDTPIFLRYGTIRANGVPFELLDPAESASGFNVCVLYGEALPKSNPALLGCPKNVELPVPSLAMRKIYFLGGIAARGWAPDKNQEHLGQPLVNLTVVHTGGHTETFVFKNGIEFADHKPRIDVPGSVYAVGIVSPEQQVRTFFVTLADSAPVEELRIENLHPVIAPVFVAITGELLNNR